MDAAGKDAKPVSNGVGVSELVRSLLQKRGFTSETDIAAFLAPDYELHTHDPFLLQGMDVAVERLLGTIAAGEHIAVYADFDCDGIPGATLLSDFFKKIGYENFEVYLPHRDREGYGFHTDAIEKLAASGVSLIITIDVGTNAADAVSFAEAKGIDVIVTDHHEIGGTLPAAVAVLNPKRGGYPFPDLCGAAVAFKLVQATLAEGKRRGTAAFTAVPEGWEKWLLGMVALATVADMVPLVGENRALAYWGLQVMRKTQRPGLRALCSACKLRVEALTEDDIGFSLAPRINAASRMDEPDTAFKLLTTGSAAEAAALAAKLEALNASRKAKVAAVVREAKRATRARYAADETVVVLGDTRWKPSLLGLAANSIVAERGGAVCLWGRDALGRLKGSCRTDDSVSLTGLFAGARDAFVECGGHERSGGFTVSHERVHELPERLRAAAAALPGARTDAPTRAPDARLSLPDITRTLFAEVSRLAPFGIGNPKPLFLVAGSTVTGVRRFGRDTNHIEVMLECRRSGASARAFEFFKSPEDFSLQPAPGLAADVHATIERDAYRGGLALRIVDITPSS